MYRIRSSDSSIRYISLDLDCQLLPKAASYSTQALRVATRSALEYQNSHLQRYELTYVTWWQVHGEDRKFTRLFSTSDIPDRGSHDSYTDQTLRVLTPLLNVSKIWPQFFRCFYMYIFNQVIVPNWAQVTNQKSKHVYFYVVNWVHYDEVKKLT